MSADPLWYKDAIIYELHVKTFCDGNGDGIGDFTGLTGKLDYLQRLGVTCLWLLPFCESPLRDDGYDVAHYERIHPDYGTCDDFVRFLDAAHTRGLRVITELVINHTSDEHPWFKAARRAPKGSLKRDFYVWSDTDQRYKGARVIFGDVETSNWAWDSVAGAYYWHRFFDHQPDLNFDNPRVKRAVMKIVRFWFDLGVDGLRLDAISHLYEREGTSCDNLPETHQFLKEVRADVDRRYQGRVLLAEANDRPEVVRAYFGDGDECTMAFHFPLMPRLFQSLATEEAAPIVDIINQTPPLPEAGQWAIFLRNHDELTLSALTKQERRPLLAVYAPEPRMRLNHGIRRRLAPLLGNDVARLVLAHALLLSLPGSPVLYYGDEIGMGDNVALADRNGVRTPMQWTDGPNAGFSTAPPADLVLPVIEDATYGSATVNVAAQERESTSLLARVTSLLHARRQHQAFGRGAIAFLRCDNPKVLGFERTYRDDTIVVVANLARSPQAAVVEFPSPMNGFYLMDAVDRSMLPPIGAAPYGLTLAPQECRWFQPVASPAVEPITGGEAVRSAR
jgi:maltose alpha-D-glucosyltransferase / alpha-amylase